MVENEDMGEQHAEHGATSRRRSEVAETAEVTQTAAVARSYPVEPSDEVEDGQDAVGEPRHLATVTATLEHPTFEEATTADLTSGHATPAESASEHPADQPSDPAPATSAVLARGLALHGSRGPVYGPVDLELSVGVLTLVQGPQGAGRSSLLLTIAGRMTPDRGGELTVLGEPLPRRRNAVQRRTAIAGFDGIDDLDESVTVGDLTRERLRWLSPWYRHTGRVSQQRFAELAGPVFGERPLPRVGSVVWDLDEVDRMLLRITLAMAQSPELLVVDDVDQVHDTERRRTVWSRLEALAADGLTVIAAVASLDEAARVPWSTPPQLVTLATGPHAIPA